MKPFALRRRLLATLGLSLLGPAVRAEPARRGEAVQWPAQLPLLDGRVLTPADLRDQVTLVVFFATDCGYCQRHNGRIEKLVQATRGEPLRVIAVAHDRQAEPVRNYLQQHRYSFAATLAQQPLHAALAERRVIPLTCVVDRSGLLREVIPGEMSEDDVLGLARWLKA